MLPKLNNSNDVALKQHNESLTYGELNKAVRQVAQWLKTNQAKRVAIAFDNSFAWVITDLACQYIASCCVPIPLFFSQAQQKHILDESQCEYLLTYKDFTALSYAPYILVDDVLDIVAYRLPQTKTLAIPTGTHKVTFTSGSTGTPKGVCLSTESQWKVAQSISETLTEIAEAKVHHLCLLPLSTLLENIAGVYAPLLRGGTIELVSSEQRGFQGSKLTDPQGLIECITHAQPTSIILVPDLLMVLLAACQQGWHPPSSLTFIAVGGAHVSPTLLAQAQHQGLPVYEGYGLSEAVSVSTLNTPNHCVLGSAGKPLGHNKLHIEDGEIVITGNHFLGYLNQPDSFFPSKVKTGDLGKLDQDMLTLSGRKKNIMVNSYGRNVSPEWVGSVFIGSGLFRHFIVYCEAKPFCVALLTPLATHISTDDITRAIAAINRQLPEYARVMDFYMIPLCTTDNRLLTDTGKLKRRDIINHYRDAIESLYSSEYIVNGD